MKQELIAAQPLTRVLGAVIDGLDLSQTADSDVTDQLQSALLEYQVLFFEDQSLTVEQFEAFVRNFGDIDSHSFISKVEGSETVEHLTQKQNVGPWVPPTSTYHIDVSMFEVPTKGAALYAVDVEDAGGDTIWVNTYAAYDALSEPIKALVSGLRGLFVAVHPNALNAIVSSGPAAHDAAQRYLQTPAEHPLVHTHPETGKKALFVDALFLWSILDLHPDESALLKNYLIQHIAKPEFQCRWRWKPGSVAIWDNRCTMHRRVDDAPGQKREMHRLPLRGADWPKA